MKTAEFLTLVLRDWHNAGRNPKVARSIMFSKTVFGEFTGQIVREIHLHDGNWKAAVADLLAGRGGVPALPRSRVLAFKVWAERITARPVRGLLPWKGGAL